MTSRFSSMYDTPDGHAQVVLEHVDVPSASRTKSVPQTCDHTPCGGLTPMHWGRKSFDCHDQLARHDVVVDDPLLVVDVVDESVERAHALLETVWR